MASTEAYGPLNIVLTAPFPAIRAGLRSLCAADSQIQILAECAGPEKWSQFIPPAQVFLLAPLGSVSPGAWQKARELSQGIPILYVLSQPLPFFPEQKSNSWGVIPFSASSDELCIALRACTAGLWTARLDLLPPLNPVLSPSENSDPDGFDEPLTAREEEILQFLALGFTNKQIAQKMNISAHTVKFHITSIYSKLGVNNRTEAARQGLRKGLINL